VTFRSRALLDLAHFIPCRAQFGHACGWTSEPAHSDSQIFGRGHGHKSADWAFAAMCHTAHMALDKFNREDKQAEWLRAFVATQNWLWENQMLKVVKQKAVAA
jgi:hypothetical protein